MERTIYEAIGGADALLALAEAWHERCLADPILAHAFEAGVHPQHTERLAAYPGRLDHALTTGRSDRALLDPVRASSEGLVTVGSRS